MTSNEYILKLKQDIQDLEDEMAIHERLINNQIERIEALECMLNEQMYHQVSNESEVTR